MNVPFVDLKIQYDSIKDEIDQAISEVIQETAFVGGKFVTSFERHFASYLGVKHCIGVGNGTAAIYIALRALGVSEGDEVITAANTFIATSEAITQTGARVRFVDCHKDSYNIDPEQIEHAITKNTKVIIPVHLYGQPAEMDAIRKIAEKRQLCIVEDAAQAHGAEYKGHKIGTSGSMACFSFYPGKNLGAYGDGGAIVSNDAELAKRVRMIANHGRIEKYDHEFEGVNSRLDGLQAAILDVKLNYLDTWTERRREVARQYDEGLKDIVVTPTVLPERKPVYHLYVIRVKQRDQLRAFLSEKGIQTGIHYPIPLPFLHAYAYLGYSPADFPVAYAYKDELLSLPMFGDITDEQVVYVIENLHEAVKER